MVILKLKSISNRMMGNNQGCKSIILIKIEIIDKVVTEEEEETVEISRNKISEMITTEVVVASSIQTVTSQMNIRQRKN